MALEVFVGTFRSLTTDTAGVTTYTLTPGFQTKAGIVFTVGRGDTADASGGATHRTSYGFFTSTTNRYVCGYMSVDAAAAGSGQQFARNDGIGATYTADTTTLDGRVDVNSITSTTVVFRVEDVLPVNITYGVIVWGGADITNAIVVEFNSGGAGTGTIDITTVGFQGTVLFLMGCDMIVNAPTADAAGAQVFFGACTGAGDEHVSWGGMDQASPSADTGAYCLAGEVGAVADRGIASPGTVADVAYEFSAWLSNGFQLNRLRHTRTGVRSYALVIQGGSWTVGDFTTLTTTGAITSESTGFGYTPKGVIVHSAMRAASTANASTIDDQRSIGVAAGSVQHAQALVDDDGPATMEVANAIDFDKVYVNIDINDAVVGLISLTSFGADGITFNQDDADPVAALAWYVASGDSPPAPSFQYPQLERVARGVGRGVVTGGR